MKTTFDKIFIKIKQMQDDFNRLCTLHDNFVFETERKLNQVRVAFVWDITEIGKRLKILEDQSGITYNPPIRTDYVDPEQPVSPSGETIKVKQLELPLETGPSLQSGEDLVVEQVITENRLDKPVDLQNKKLFHKEF